MNGVKMLRIAVCVGVVLACCQAALAEPVQPSMPDYSWLFDEGTGTTSAAYTGGHNATLEGAAAWSTNVKFAYEGNHSISIGRAAAADVIASGHTIGTAGSISMWLLTTLDPGSITTGNWWFSLDNTDSNRTLAYLNGSNKITNEFVNGVAYANGSLINNTLFPKNVWHNFVMVWDNSLSTKKYKVYLDGIEKWSSNTAAGAATTPETLVFGTKFDKTVASNWPGPIDEYAFWNTALSADEVSWLFQHSLKEIPEPSTLALLAAGLIGLLAYAWRKRK